MEPAKVYPIVVVLSLVTVEYGGWALLSFVSARRGQLNDFQTQFFRAGHAHAGVLLVLSLVYFLYLDARTDFSLSTQWVVGAVLLGGVLAQSGGFFVHSWSSPSASPVHNSSRPRPRGKRRVKALET